MPQHKQSPCVPQSCTQSVPTYLCQCKCNGLCNRLIYLVSSQALAHVLGARLICEWKWSFDCDAEWADLFRDVGWFHTDKHYANDIECISVGTVWFDQFYLKYLRDVCGWEEFRQATINYLAQLQPVAEVQSLVLSGVPPKPYVAVHIRMTDNVRWFQRTRPSVAERFAVLADYLDIIGREIDSGMHVFVATDNRRVQQQIERTYMDRVSFLSKSWRTRPCLVLRRDLKISRMFQMKRTTPITVALADLLLLSGAQRLYGTYHSTYCKLAAVIGKVTNFHMVTKAGLVQSKDVDMMIRDGSPFNGDDAS